MIRIKIAELLGKHKMSRKDLADEADIRPATVSTLYDETAKRLDIDMLDRICKTLDCRIEDVLEYIPNLDTTQFDKYKNSSQFQQFQQQLIDQGDYQTQVADDNSSYDTSQPNLFAKHIKAPTIYTARNGKVEPLNPDKNDSNK